MNTLPTILNNTCMIYILFLKDIFMTGIWLNIPLPLLGDLKLGTPFLLDIGVFLAVIGVTLMFFFTLTKIAKWK